jgi:hypothetical protein
MGRFLNRHWLPLALCFAGTLANAQQPSDPTPPTPPTPPTTATAAQPLPAIHELLLDVERNEKAAEAARKDYTYHVHSEQQDLDSKGAVKKTTVLDAESVTIEGVRINRTVARDGKPLTPEEAKKESDRIDKEIAKAKERRVKREGKGEDTDSRGDVILPASRILELGNFTNPRRVDLDGRPTVVFDFAGDPNAKTHNDFEGVVRDIVGTVWIDEQDRVLVRGEGHFLNDFKVGGGLVLNVHKGLSFDFRTTKINGEVWLPASVNGQGSARFLLLDKINGRFRFVTSDYRKFRASSTIIESNRLIGPDGQPLPDQPPAAPVSPAIQQPQQPQP